MPGFSMSIGLSPSMVAAIAEPLKLPSWLLIRISEGLLTCLKPPACIFIYPQLVGGAKTILYSPQQSIYVVSIALKLQYSVYHVLEHLWTGQRAFFGDMTNQKNRGLRDFGKFY